MKISATRSRKKLWIAGIIAAIIVIGAGAYVHAIQSSQKAQNSSDSTKTTPRTNPTVDDRSVNYDKPSDDEIKAGQDTKKENVDTTKPTNTDNPGSSDQALTTNVNYADGKVTIRSIIPAAVSDGSCTVTLSKGSSVVSKGPVGVQALSSYSTCKGWDIASSELSSGTWTVKVSASYQSKTASSTNTVNLP